MSKKWWDQQVPTEPEPLHIQPRRGRESLKILQTSIHPERTRKFSFLLGFKYICACRNTQGLTQRSPARFHCRSCKQRCKKQTTIYGKEHKFLCLVCGLGTYGLREEFPAAAKEAQPVAGGFSLDTSPTRDDHSRVQSRFTSTEETRSILRSLSHHEPEVPQQSLCRRLRAF